MQFIIYALCEPGSDEIRYIGRSSSLLKRPMHHLFEAKQTNDDGSWKSQLYVHRWIRSLPEMEYDIRIIEECSPDETDPNQWLNIRERFWIAHYREQGHALTNTTDGGMGILGYRHTDEAKEKIAEAGRGREFSEERRKNIAESVSGEKNGRYGIGNRGYRHTEETKKLLAEQQLGSKRPDQSGDRHWTARRGSDPSLKKPGVKGTRVVCENDGREFDSGIEAARFYGVSGSVVSRALEGHSNRKGLRFRRLRS